jgi:preprotein translocase subunit Sec63
MSTTEEEINPYELIGITSEATDAEIKTAYRQRSLKVHPDRVCTLLLKLLYTELIYYRTVAILMLVSFLMLLF